MNFCASIFNPGWRELLVRAFRVRAHKTPVCGTFRQPSSRTGYSGLIPPPITIFALLLALLVPLNCRAQNADASRHPTPDTRTPMLLLRVENIALGRIEVSVDGGAHYRLAGRVTQAAKIPDVDRSADRAGVVLRSGGDGLAFAVAPGQALKLFPRPAPRVRKKRGKTFVIPAAQEKSGIYTNLLAKSGVFGEFVPLRGAAVRFQSDTGRVQPFPENFNTDERNVFVFTLNTPPFSATDRDATAQAKLNSLADAYDAAAVVRARAAHCAIVSGVWTLRAKLPAGEPDPIVYVSYLVDDDTVATQNTAPFSFGWDTKIVPNGEHLIEIRALNRSGNLVTHVRALVVVDNPK